jgi:hypothetical protein
MGHDTCNAALRRAVRQEWFDAANSVRRDHGVESVNRNLKRSQYEDIADPEKRAVRGNTFTYLVMALATVVENLRNIISFYKRQLSITTLSAQWVRGFRQVFSGCPDESPGLGF